mmetsp:Transcript_10435/g.11329  ORF Transcript_10435/g.11329 Transcript_10435/m.11329 type:complete len:165 (-) Transcript_10435:319-813(-)
MEELALTRGIKKEDEEDMQLIPEVSHHKLSPSKTSSAVDDYMSDLQRALANLELSCHPEILSDKTFADMCIYEFNEWENENRTATSQAEDEEMREEMFFEALIDDYTKNSADVREICSFCQTNSDDPKNSHTTQCGHSACKSCWNSSFRGTGGCSVCSKTENKD